jgi:RNA polymerase sigma-70 factor, ECF subfamily
LSNPCEHAIVLARLAHVRPTIQPGGVSPLECRLESDLLEALSRRASRPPAPPFASDPRPMPKPTDRDLVDGARQGSSPAFGELVRRHQPRIFRLAAHMLRDNAEAEDVTQETFVRAYQALARFDGRSEPYTWFYRIAVNLSLNRIRSRRSSRTSQSSDDPRMAAILAEGHPAARGDPAGDAAGAQLYRALCEGIDDLSESLRTTLILVCIDGRSHEEASAILGAPEGTIAWRVHEARRKLKESLVLRGFDPERDPP